MLLHNRYTKLNKPKKEKQQLPVFDKCQAIIQIWAPNPGQLHVHRKNE